MEFGALPLLALLVVGAVGVLVGIWRLLGRVLPPKPERPVLPSHYSSLLYTQSEHYPGHCTSCGTDNEPGYRYCEDCGSRIPTSSEFASGADLRRIFDE